MAVTAQVWKNLLSELPVCGQGPLWVFVFKCHNFGVKTGASCGVCLCAGFLVQSGLLTSVVQELEESCTMTALIQEGSITVYLDNLTVPLVYDVVHCFRIP